MMTIRTPPRLGLDIGGVIVDRAYHDTDTSFFGNQPMDTPAVDGAIKAIRELADRFDQRVHLVSRAGPKISGITRDWLAHTGFFAATGIPEQNLVFVRRRPDKAPVCQRLRITHFVDDSIGVLGHLETVPHRYLFLGGTPVEEYPPDCPDWATACFTWADVTETITGTLA